MLQSDFFFSNCTKSKKQNKFRIQDATFSVSVVSEKIVQFAVRRRSIRTDFVASFLLVIAEWKSSQISRLSSRDWSLSGVSAF